MTLSTALAKSFAHDIQRRGRTSYRSGHVRIHEGTPWSVQARMQGSRDEVSLTRQGNVVTGSCTCSLVAAPAEPCQHLWATVLATEVYGYLLGDGKQQALFFRFEDSGDSGGGDVADCHGMDFEDLEDIPAPPSVRLLYAPRSQRAPRGGWWAVPRRTPPAAPPSWKTALTTMHTAEEKRVHSQNAWATTRQVLYIIDMPRTLSSGRVLLELAERKRRKSDGAWGKPKPIRINAQQVEHLPEDIDRQVLTTLFGAREYYGYSDAYADPYAYSTTSGRYYLSDSLQHLLMPLLCRSGRCCLRLTPTATAFPVITWDDGLPWQFRLQMQRDAAKRQYVLTGCLQRQTEQGVEHLDLKTPAVFTAGGFLFMQEHVTRFEHGDTFAWIPYLRQHGSMTIPFAQGQAFLTEFFALAQYPSISLPAELQYEELHVLPQPKITLRPFQERQLQDRVGADVVFQYGERIVPRRTTNGGVYDRATRRLLVRHHASEQAALATLQQLGFKEQNAYPEPQPVLTLPASRVPRVVRQLIEHGWVVEAEGKLYRRPGAFRLKVSSGIDWFELHGTVEFDSLTAELPAVLAALQRGDNMVRLDDGTYGLLPEAWLKKYGLLAGLGSAQSDHVRFSKAQTGLLDALLASQPEASLDATFAQAREQLQRFSGITPADPPAGFQGTLRAYQREGLGWLHFLRQFGFGGCLADDMGLGKTVQVLALLASRRPADTDGAQAQGQRPAASLVVVPKSLVFNWTQEAARFTPQLRVLEYTGQGRKKGQTDHFHDYDIILTTYGTLRNDAVLFKDVRFDYVILDEAQAIKNADTESAKAARLLRGDYKLALSGTPIENHLGELWSLCEFLNPGMLGTASIFASTATASRHPDADTGQLLAQALRPFILRRTKAQVAPDLPEKIEQTIFCQLEPKQCKLYNEVRDHYRRTVLGPIRDAEINTSKIVILEALLRLRQVACHPGLLDATRTSESSAKLDVLLPKIVEAMAEGHKTLIFSQFTSLLAIVRAHLDKEGIVYEYLDGRTRNRQERVERFQTEPECKLFLISLKAGGLGLNLTAADNVFLLDPWWNPAVEAQAIDRTHRIGQTKQVFACRLIAKDTVEDKVLELQNSKRDLADAIIRADNSLIRTLQREDLELLLS